MAWVGEFICTPVDKGLWQSLGEGSGTRDYAPQVSNSGVEAGIAMKAVLGSVGGFNAGVLSCFVPMIAALWLGWDQDGLGLQFIN
mmetsp:Transcript_38156/g.89532  ORF Transcript_38156/g.89532 Transcript_38156/m.89532 type:complete len:85 (+) Transcript_38156:346-600(+)